MTALPVNHAVLDHNDTTERPDAIRVDLQLIASMIESGSRVLDVGCGDGALLFHLVRYMGVDGRGIELSQAGVNNSVRRGLSVVQGDADTDLKDYPDQAFDYVVLSQTLQAVRNPRDVLEQLLRIGRRAIVSFPNFGHWRCRLQLLFRGVMPRTQLINHEWYETPNIHLCTINDFVRLCDALEITIDRRFAVDHEGMVGGMRGLRRFENLFGEQGVFMLTRSRAGHD